MIRFEVGQEVEIMEPQGGRGKWAWVHPPSIGLVTKVDEHCLEVRRDDNGKIDRDVREHFRPVPK